MTPVPSTPTSSDRQEEVRKLNLEIAKLVSVKDTATRTATDAQNSAQDATERAKGIRSQIEELEGVLGTVGAETRAFLEACGHAMQEATVSMAEVAQKAKELADHIDQLGTEIANLSKRRDDLLASMNREQELMSTQRRDLDIYKQRIIKAAAEHLPGQPVIV